MSVAIERRYSALAESSSTLSCGSSVKHADVRPGQVCVDLGCGRGADVLHLAEKVGPGGRAIGIDLTPAMLEKARQAAAALGLANATFLRCPLQHLELGDASADWVLSNCALNHAADKAAVWREIHRVLRPGGRFVVSDIYALEAIAPEHREDPEAVAQCWAGAVLKDEYLEHIRQAGLGGVQVLAESAPYSRGAARVVSFTVAGQRLAPA